MWRKRLEQFNASELKKEIMGNLGKLQTKFSGVNLELEKVNYLESLIDNLKDSLVVSEDKKDVTRAFIMGLRNMVQDPNSAPKIYGLEEIPLEAFDQMRGYKRYPKNIIQNISIPAKIKYLLQNDEIGRMMYHIDSTGVFYVEYIEILDFYKSNFSVRNVCENLCLSALGVGGRLDFSPDCFGVSKL